MNRDDFFAHLWQDFTHIAPAAAALKAALLADGEQVINDHVAFRTFDVGPWRLDALEPLLLELGYTRFAPYQFEQKRLRAFGYTCPGAPRIFLSELETAKFSEGLQRTVAELVAQIDDGPLSAELFWSGRPWAPVHHETWQALQSESEYAAWVAAHGLRANHFTVSVNALSEPLRSLEAILRYAEGQGLQISESGGRIKGSAEVLLEQGSTVADRVPVEFADGTHVVPSCYYEFALRHPDETGALFEGFVARSADRIFESTHVGGH
ncbi:MAG: DUF1338 domain-containing protein [Bradymonadia bacterium]